jgi:hypothetical protein
MAPRIMVRREGAAALLAVTMMAWLATPAFTQGIRIPDFRKGEETAVRLKPGEACDNCGVIRSIREVPLQRPVPVPQQVRSDPTSVDRTVGREMPIGAVIALPLGDGGRPYVGGVGTPEMRERFAETTYDITVQLDRGGYTSVQRADGARYQAGDRVRLRGVQMELLAK